MRWVVVVFIPAFACGRIAFDPIGSGLDGGNGAASSCRTLHASNNSLPDGIYEIDTDGTGPLSARRVYCDMTTSGGGWTLVGRSVAGAPAGTFGWRDAVGDVDVDGAPYSLGPVISELAFTDLLIGSHSGTKAIASYGYTLAAGPDFVSTYAQASLRSESTTVVGTCAPAPFVTMLLFKGQTDLPGVFWFRDSQFVGGTPHGLFPGGWDTYYPGDCNQGGLLHGTQGVIYVR